MRNFLFGRQIGSPAYLCTLVTTAPRVSMAFYRHLVEGRSDEARQIVFEFEEVILNAAGELGWHEMIKGALHLTGHFPTGLRRPPCASLRPEHEAHVRGMLEMLQGKAEALGLEGPLER